MVRIVALAVFVMLARGVCAIAQDSECAANVPKQTVEALWTSAARGELLTSKGWDRAVANFTQPGTPDEHGPIQVVSDYFGVNSYDMKGTSATVDMEFTDLGQIDASLRYRPPTQTQAYKTSVRYQLVSGPSYALTFGPDGKTVVDRKVVPGITSWHISGAPPARWVTVDAAIRYVLERRSKTEDSNIRSNADETISKLLELH